MSNVVDYIQCSSCGYEDFDVEVAFSRRTASDELWFCPNCGEETANVGHGVDDH